MGGAAAEVLPMPISPNSSALPGSAASSRAPWRSACSACERVIAGATLASAVPCSQPSTLATCSPCWGAKSWATPQSTTVSARPCWRASTDTAAPPAMKFSTICAVTSGG